MEIFINRNIAYLLIVIAVMLLLLTFNDSKFTWPKVVMVLCLAAAGYEFVYLTVNPWAFLTVALSPLPFFLAIRQARFNNPLVFITILMLMLGSFFLFVDQQNHPAVNYGLAGLVSALGSTIIWRATNRQMRNEDNIKLSDDPNSVVGLIGEVRRDIEPHSPGSVLVEGEEWQALSKNPIRAGSTVRVLQQSEFFLTVKEVKNLNKKV